jgi:hypothetical protein
LDSSKVSQSPDSSNAVVSKSTEILNSSVSVDSVKVLDSSEPLVISVPVNSVQSHASVVLNTSDMLNSSKTVDVSCPDSPEISDSS